MPADDEAHVLGADGEAVVRSAVLGWRTALARQDRSDPARAMDLAPIKRPGRRLAAVLRIDEAISLGFGVATALIQSAIFNTAVDLKSAGAVTPGIVGGRFHHR